MIPQACECHITSTGNNICGDKTTIQIRSKYCDIKAHHVIQIKLLLFRHYLYHDQCKPLTTPT